jgi:YVTN family beta-propeller protein
MAPRTASFRSALLGATAGLAFAATGAARAAPGTLLPNGQTLTPLAATGAMLQELNPGLASNPNYRATHAMNQALSPDGNTLLVMTTGYNLLNYGVGTTKHGQNNPAGSNEYIFVFNVSGANAAKPVLAQVIQQTNSFYGLVWAPNSQSFYASGGPNDAVYQYSVNAGTWALSATIPLGHTSYANNLTGAAALLGAFLSNGIGFEEKATAAGLALTADGSRLLVANMFNDSVSLINTATNAVLWEYDLRPYNNTPSLTGTAGGESPFAVSLAGNATTGYTAFVGSVRDREVDAFPLRDIPPDSGTIARIAVPGTPFGLAVSPDQSKVYVAEDNTDQIGIISTANLTLAGSIDPLAVPGLSINHNYRGAAPNNVAVSADGTRLYVTNGGSNALSIIDLTQSPPAPLALVPTGWYPHSVSVSPNGQNLFVVNGKSDPGPNPGYRNSANNQYILQLEKGGLLSMPAPSTSSYGALTQQVASNNGFGTVISTSPVISFLQSHIKHVIYVIKENRTYDQILGDLNNGANGDPKLAYYGRHVTPNLHRLAAGFVTLDNFYCAGEVSGEGWPWATEARESDYGAKTIPFNYANRGASNDSEGLNRIVNVGIGTTAGRIAAFPTVGVFGSIYNDLGGAFPGGTTNLLPGTNNDYATDGPVGTPAQQGYLWDSAMRAGLSVRDYGFLIDIVRYNIPVAVGGIPLIQNPYASGTQVAWSANPTLTPITDIYYRGFDNSFPDTWRLQEWNREFQQYVAGNNLPNLTLLRLMHDHTGNFCPAPYTASNCPAASLNTPEQQEADNDYAVGTLIQTVAHSPYAKDTLIFILEDDAQDGPDHVNAHRSTAYVVGPYVKRKAVVNTHYSTVNMVRTIEDVLGIDHLSLNDSTQVPMTDLFDISANGAPSFVYKASASPLLKGTGLVADASIFEAGSSKPMHDGDWWAKQTKGFNWSSEDKIPSDLYNRIQWEAYNPGVPYPETPGATATPGND